MMRVAGGLFVMWSFIAGAQADTRVPVKYDDPEAEALHYDLPQQNLTMFKFKRTEELLPKAKISAWSRQCF